MENKACIFNIQRFSLHDGPGIRTSVFFKGCPLSCSWCSNPESQSCLPEKIWDNSKKDYVTTGEYKTIEELMEIILKDRNYYKESNGGVTLTGGEVLLQSKFAKKLLIECKKHGIHTACETSAFSSFEIFSSFIPYIDHLIIDIKHYDQKKHKEKTNGDLNIILQNIEYAISNHNDVLIRIPIIPDYNNSIEDAYNFINLLKSYNIKKVELLPFHQLGKNKYNYLDKPYEFDNRKQLYNEDLIELKKIFAEFNISLV